jgi:hypothetical protein
MRTTGDQLTFQERLFEVFHAHTLLIHDIFGRSSRKQPRELVVKVDEILRNPSSLRLVCLQNARLSNTFNNQSQLPAQVVRILHADIHALARFRRMCMHSITSQKHAAVMVEVLANSLADLVCCPPIAVLVRQIIWRYDLLCSRDDGIRRNFRPVGSSTGVWFDLFKLDIEPSELVLAGDDHHRASRRAVDGAALSNIRKVCDGYDVQNLILSA